MEPIGDSEAVELHVIGLDGNCLDFRLSAATTGLEVARMIKAMLPEKKGARILLHGHDLHMTKTWHAQGLPADATLTSVSCHFSWHTCNGMESRHRYIFRGFLCFFYLPLKASERWGYYCVSCKIMPNEFVLINPVFHRKKGKTMSREIHGIKWQPFLRHIIISLIAPWALGWQRSARTRSFITAQVFVPATVNAAWSFLKGYPVYEEELALQGVTKLSGIQFEDELGDLPETLEARNLYWSVPWVDGCECGMIWKWDDMDR